MAKAVVLQLGDALRTEAEALIKTAYWEQYGATIKVFPAQLLVFIENNIVQCAAGLRTEAEGFFSECYLDEPINSVLSNETKQFVSRDKIFEVTTLASRAPLITGNFVAALVAYGETRGFSWSFFTLTHRLAFLVRRLGLAPVYLAPATSNRVEDADLWGEYYASDPKVYAVPSVRIPNNRLANGRIARHAHAV